MFKLCLNKQFAAKCCKYVRTVCWKSQRNVWLFFPCQVSIRGPSLADTCYGEGESPGMSKFAHILEAWLFPLQSNRLMENNGNWVGFHEIMRDLLKSSWKMKDQTKYPSNSFVDDFAFLSDQAFRSLFYLCLFCGGRSMLMFYCKLNVVERLNSGMNTIDYTIDIYRLYYRHL